MTTFFENLRNDIGKLKNQLATKEYELSCGVKACQHKWSEPIADHIYHEAYTIVGDRPGDPGYGGVDRQFDCHVPAKTEKRWKRTCSVCGEVEHTTNTTKHITEEPRF